MLQGDNDINLDLSNPAHLQGFVEEYHELIIVLLHASYPYTTQAGYLASVYENTFLDIGEVFPFLRYVSRNSFASTGPLRTSFYSILACSWFGPIEEALQMACVMLSFKTPPRTLIP